MFAKKKTPSELLRDQNKQLRKAQRDVERDGKELDRQEQQLMLEIKKAAKQGNKQVCAVLAKNLVQVRKQKARTLTATSKIQSIGSQAKVIHSNVKLADTVSTTAKTMGAVNKSLNPQGMMKTMQDFEKESMKMAMTEEIVDEGLSSVLDDSGDEEEEDAVVNQVLDEIGIEISGKLAEAPSALSSTLGETSKARGITDDELEKQLARLKT